MRKSDRRPQVGYSGVAWIQLGLAFGTFVCIAILMTMAQQYSDSLPDYMPAIGPFQDLGFEVIPDLTRLGWETLSHWSNIADVWIAVSYAIFLFLLLPFALHQPLLALTRFLWCMSYAFGLRALTVLVTRYPKLPFKMDNYVGSNVLWGSILLVLGIRATATDMMFSGHTVGWIMTASFVSRYSHYAWWSYLYWAFNVTGIILLISVREHYTSDVLVAIAIAKLVYWTYHLALDDEYIRFIRPGFYVDAPHPTHLVLPAKIHSSTMDTGHMYIVPEKDVARVGMKKRGRVFAIPYAVTRRKFVRIKDRNVWRTVVETHTNYLSPGQQLYWMFKWLDGTL